MNYCRKSLWSMAIKAGAIVASLVMISLVMVGCAKKDDQELYVRYADVTEDQKAYIMLENGKYIEIKDDDVDQAAITKDRKHIIVLLQDGTLYVTDKKQSKKHEIADNCNYIETVRDDGFLYREKSESSYEAGRVCRVKFSDNSVVKLGEFYNYAVAQDNISVAYVDNGKIYTLAASSDDKVKVASYDQDNESANVHAISNNGQTAVWSVEKDQGNYYYLSYKGEKETLGKTDYSGYCQAIFTKDQKMLIVSPNNSEKIWIKKDGKETVEVEFNDYTNYAIYTSHDYIGEVNANQASSFYLSTDGGFYNVTSKGEKQKVSKSMKDYTIADGKIFYIDDNNNLYCGKIDKDQIKDQTKIASSANSYYIVSQDGKYVYFTKDRDDENVLYGYKYGDKEPTKIDSDVSENFGVSKDGKTVCYFTDSETTDTGCTIGILRTWTYRAKEPVKISSDIYEYSVKFDAKNSISYIKYRYTDDYTDYGDLMYYNGKEPKKIASDVEL